MIFLNEIHKPKKDALQAAWILPSRASVFVVLALGFNHF